MALTFEYTKNLNTGSQPYIAHEPDSSNNNYYIDGEQAKDRSSPEVLGIYDNITFSNEDSSNTTHAVNSIGVKNFPGIGAIAFYTDSYLDEAHIVAPVHNRPDKHEAPVLTTAEIVDDKMHIVITPNKDIKYKCYRVIARQGTFAFEYITYKTECLVDAPSVIGEYSVYCIGYDEAYSSISEDSNIIEITIENGSPDWSPVDTNSLAKRVSAIEDDLVPYDSSALNSEIDAILKGGAP